MAKFLDVLGMNAREQVYTSLNSSKAKRYGFSKLRSKAFLRKHGIQVPELYAVISSQEDLREFNWKSIIGGFAVKPSNGLAGNGVLVITGRGKKSGKWLSVDGRRLSVEDLRLHASDILDGEYSTWGAAANVIVEERIPIHPDLEKYVAMGTPDVRVILFNKIPVIAMSRFPTRKSGGRANLDQGALGLGIDMGTGKTIYAVSGKKTVIKTFPETATPVSGIRIPFWTDALKTAARVANATGLKYMGVDIFLHPEKGSMVAEVNAYPGLSIQLANNAGLRKRLRRLEGIKAKNVNHAVKIGQSLFAVSYPESPVGDMDRTVLSPQESVEIYGKGTRHIEGMALVNTGRLWSAISFTTAKKLGLADQRNVLWTQYIEGEGNAYVVEVKYRLKETIRTSTMIVSKKLDSSKYILHLGRRDLSGYLVGRL